MKRVLALLPAFVLLTAFAGVSAAQQAPAVGTYQEVSKDDPEVVAAARFAVAEENRRERARVSLVSVNRAERQVVAGFNYRLRLSVMAGGARREVSAVVYRNLKDAYALTAWESSGGAGARGATREVKVYLVAVGDAGKAGRKIGCDDSLVPVTRTVRAGGDVLRAAVEELLSLPHEYEGGLSNFWWGDGLKVRGVTIRAGTATIRLSGRVYVAGVCDEPRIEEQIKETARQFPGVRRARVFVGGRPLAQVIR
jgi:hypothetical protein